MLSIGSVSFFVISTNSGRRYVKLGTFKEEVSEIILLDFKHYLSLGRRVHFFDSLRIFFCFQILNFVPINKMCFSVVFLQYLTGICAISIRKVFSILNLAVKHFQMAFKVENFYL